MIRAALCRLSAIASGIHSASPVTLPHPSLCLTRFILINIRKRIIDSVAERMPRALPGMLFADSLPDNLEKHYGGCG